jgi:hypothetical protein
MLLQLRDGRTVYISSYEYLEMTEQEIRELMGYAHIGFYINNPHFLSSLEADSIIEDYIEDENESYDEPFYYEDFDNINPFD